MSAGALTLRPALLDDARFVWDVNNHPSVRAQSISTASIPWETHEAWFAKRLERDDTLFFIGTLEGERVAVVRFDVQDAEAVISVAVAPAHRGKGLGTQLITSATRELARARPSTRAVALVRPDNDVSLRAFARAGYVRVGSSVKNEVSLERLECSA